MQMALAAVCSASRTPVSGSGSSGRSTSHLCLVKLPTCETVASAETTELCVCVVVCGWFVSFLASCGYTHGLPGLILGKASTSPQMVLQGGVTSVSLYWQMVCLTSFLWVNGLFIRVKGFLILLFMNVRMAKWVRCSGDIPIYTSWNFSVIATRASNSANKLFNGSWDERGPLVGNTTWRSFWGTSFCGCPSINHRHVSTCESSPHVLWAVLASSVHM